MQEIPYELPLPHERASSFDLGEDMPGIPDLEDVGADADMLNTQTAPDESYDLYDSGDTGSVYVRDRPSHPDEVAGGAYEAPAAVLPPVAIVHFQADGGIVTGEHPDAYLRSLAEAAAGEIGAQYARIDAAIRAMPTYNHVFGPEIAIMRKQSGDVPIAILGPAEYGRLSKMIGADEGLSAAFIAGTVVIPVTQRDMDVYGPRDVLRKGLHEMGHTECTDKMPALAIYEWPVIGANVGYVAGELGTYSAVNMMIGGLAVPNPYATHEQNIKLGSFWDEGYVESRSVRTTEDHDMGWRTQGSHTALGLDLGGGKEILYADTTENKPHLEEGRLYLPWKYVGGLAQFSDKHVTDVITVTPAFAAYGIDLLDAYLPGLFNTMRRSQKEPALRHEVKRQIDTVRPGLYDQQAALPYTPEGFYRGVVNIIAALGIQHELV